VAEDSVVPSEHMAIGVPAKIRPIPDPTPIQDWMTYAIDFYVSNAAKFAKELRRLD
jgi:carbonic anhydrase/acetyltransferase-like protein (isoleucine patch superfamily)